MAEIHPYQPFEGKSDGGGIHQPSPTFPITPAPTTSAPPLFPVGGENVTSKRQRRPSVRLGEIGDQPASTATLLHDAQRRTKPQVPRWRGLNNKDPGCKASKIRQLAKLASGGEQQETLGSGEEADFDNLAIGGWKMAKDGKSKRVAGTKRPRTKWNPKIEEGSGEGGVEELSCDRGRDRHPYYGGDADEDGKFGFARDFSPVGSETPSKEQSPAHSLEIDRGHGQGRRPRIAGVASRVLENHADGRSDNKDRIVGSGHNNNSDDGGGAAAWGWSQEEGVKNWLNGLGLSRYWPVFEIHEVDEEVLPMLTLEDLKDMGINAVGSRRKIYSAIQKLSKGFS